jgi:hypothetical protein
MLSPTKLEIRAKQFLPGSEGVEGRGKVWRKKRGLGEGGRNDSNISCTYEEKKIITK